MIATARKNMADKGGFFAKTVQKHAGRAKEKLLQNLGKADKTTDDIFDEYVNNFKKQETNANKLHKEIRNYVTCAKALQQASKSLFEVVNETYEPDWIGHDQLYIKTQALEMFWTDYHHKLNEQILIPLNTYQNQFAEVRKRVDKRGRKLVDYDGSRHAYEALLNNTKKRDDAKVSKAKEQLEDSRRLYEILNSELYDELPALYDSRIPFLVSNLQTLFSAEAVFHQEMTKLNNELSEIMEELADENQKGTYNSRKLHSSSPTSPKGVPVIISSSRARMQHHLRGYNRNPESEHSEDTNQEQVENAESAEFRTKDDADARQYEEIDFKKADGRGTGLVKVFNVADRNGDVGSTSPEGPGGHKNEGRLGQYEQTNEQDESGEMSANQNDGKRVEELYDIPVGATTENLPSGVLYRVKATYRYVAEDEDELAFEVGETIQVIEFDDPEEQEEGWLLGIKEADDTKGLFPANFTRPI